MKQMKPRGPFKIVENCLPEIDDENGLMTTYEASFPLPDDGCPGPARELVLQVISQGKTQLLTLAIRHHATREILSAKPITVDDAADLLYGAARLRTIKVLEPLQEGE